MLADYYNLYVTDENVISEKVKRDLSTIIIKRKRVQVEYACQSVNVVYYTLNNAVQVRIVFSNLYPFLKPDIQINNDDYYYWLNRNTSNEKHVMNILRYDCPCCSSILRKWSPLKTIDAIMYEIDHYSYFIFIVNSLSKYINDGLKKERRDKLELSWLYDNVLDYLM